VTRRQGFLAEDRSLLRFLAQQAAGLWAFILTYEGINEMGSKLRLAYA
jgi:hypothetical protein